MSAPITDEQLHELLRTELPRELDADEPPELARTSLLRARRIRRRRIGGAILAGVIAVVLVLTGVVTVPRLVHDHSAPPPPIGGPPAVVPTIRLDDALPHGPGTVAVPYLDGTTWHRADGTIVQLPAFPAGAGPLVQAPIETRGGLFVEWWDDASMSTASYRIGSGDVVPAPAGLGIGFPYEGGVIFGLDPPDGSARLYQIRADGTAGPVQARFDADHQLQGVAGGKLWAGDITDDGTVVRNGTPVPGYLAVAWSDPTAGVVALWKKVDSECQVLVRADDLTVLNPNVCGTIMAISPDATRLLVSTARDRFLVIDTATGATLSTITVDSHEPRTSGGHSVKTQFTDRDHVVIITDLAADETSFAVVSVDLTTGAALQVTDQGPEGRFWLVRGGS